MAPGHHKTGRSRVASATALLLATGAVVVYAATSDGYRSHRTDLNDGGIWVVNSAKGIHGRINKPINQLDGVVQEDRSQLSLDVVQDGAAVVTLNEGQGRGRLVDPRRLVFADGAAASLPPGGDVAMAGGTLATADPATGRVWATHVDAQSGTGLITSVDQQTKPRATLGGQASLTITQSGDVVVVSADEGEVSWLEADAEGFDKPRSEALPDDAGKPDALTAVGDRVVTLDSTTGQLSVVGGAATRVPEGSVLQQAGPAAATVLVATPAGLLEIDLGTGSTSVVVAAGGTPVPPVRLGACVYGAWSGGQGAFAQRCGEQDDVTSEPLGGDATDVAFRVNRGEIVLNDSASGAVWDVQLDTPVRIDNWSAFTATSKTEDDDESDEETNEVDRRPPLAKPDTYGVRAGRTTVLHPLDNDSAPEGRLLSIIEVSRPTGGARAQISPDGQTIIVSMPEDGRATTFDYFIDDGRANVSANATVQVVARGEGENAPPAPRQGYAPRTYKVPAGGAVSVPVLSEWRDEKDGDTLQLETATVTGGTSSASARTTSDGRIRFSAPVEENAPAQTVRVAYRVGDGRSVAVEREIEFEVQGASDQTSHAPVAEPDVLRGEVGGPIKIRPLLNDLAGADPATPNAELSLGGRIPGQRDLEIVTELDSGTVTVTATKPGTYFIDYDAAYGLAPLDKGVIRLDVLARASRTRDPIAMPDTLTVFGQAPGLVDVLSNDLDPSGGLLVVQRAVATTVGQLDVAIVDGRWLRISARVPDLAPATQTITYSISNGSRSGVRGEVVVSQRPEPADNRPVTVTDRAVVRAGSSVSVPVLDNDSSPSGDRLALAGDVSGGAVGELDVVAPLDVTYRPGTAYLAGRVVRYVAPGGLTERDTFEVPYVAVNSPGDTAAGRLLVTVVPDTEKNTAPEPPALEARSTSGQIVKLRVPGVGVDAEGDPVTLAGIVEAPALGRIVRFGGNFIEYQSYPRAVGTDTFSYAVTDSHGALGTGTARVAVVGSDTSQPPLAVNDTLVIEPGRTAYFDPLANDVIAPGDRATLELVDAPDGVSLDQRTNLVAVDAPDALTDPARTIVYSLSNGIEQSRATLTLETAAEHDNPPVVYDAFGRAGDSGSVVVDVLEDAYDPDGPADELRVESVAGEPEGSIDGGEVRIERTTAPRVVPFRVVDGNGSAATGSVYVPASGVGFPYVDPDARITLDSGGTVRGSLTDHVVVPEGSDLRLTGRAASASPTLGLSARASGDSSYSLTAAEDYRGPGALLVEVTTATDASGNEDVADTTDGFTAMLSIPVQVGDDRPELTCPETVIPISAGQAHEVDVAAVCDVWTVDPRDAAGLDYTAEWATPADGLAIDEVAGSVVQVRASAAANEGGDAVLRVRAGSSNAEEITFRLSQAPPPRLLPVPVRDLKAGESRTLDLAPYLEAGVADPEPTIVSVRTRGGGVRATHVGSRLTLTAGPQASGDTVIDLVMSDISSDDPPAGRRVAGRISFSTGALPGQPGTPVKVPLDRKNAVAFSWTPPRSDGGAKISHYLLAPVAGGGKPTRCATTYCIYRGVKDDTNYRFRVRAVNKVGEGPWSANSLEVKGDTRPGRVGEISMVSRGDGFVELGWSKPVSASPVLDYTIVWQGAPAVVIDGSLTTYVAGALDNNRTYAFTIKARNKLGHGTPRTSDPMQSVGNPAPPGSLAVTDLQTGDARTTFRASWQATAPQGPGPVTYTLFHDTDGSPDRPVPGCQRITGTSCAHADVEYDGKTYTYSVTAYNQPGRASVPSTPVSRAAVGRPARWGAWQVKPNGRNNELVVRGTVPDPRGAGGKVDILADGAIVDSFSAVAGQGFERTVRTVSNAAATTVELRLCNSAAASSGCELSPPQSAQSYGPLDGALESITPIVTGKSVQWLIKGTSNGNAAVLAFEVRNRRGATTGVRQHRLVEAGGFEFTTEPFSTESFNQEQEIFVTLSDDDPGGRGQDADSRAVTSGPPPPPSISIGRGARCQDGAENQPACAEIAEPECSVDTCAYATLTIVFAPGTPTTSWTCNFDKFWPRRRPSGTGDFSGQVSPYYAAGDRVLGNCSFGSPYATINFDTLFPS